MVERHEDNEARIALGEAERNKSTATSDAGNASTFEYKRQLYEVYQEERRHLTEAEGALDHAISTAVLTVSGGALGISLTVVKDFDAMIAAAASPLLGAAWSLLALALLLSLLALKINQETHSRFRTILDEECARDLDGAFERARTRQQSSWFRRVLRFADWTSVILCVVGTALLFIFAYMVVAKGVTPDAPARALPTTITAS